MTLANIINSPEIYLSFPENKSLTRGVFGKLELFIINLKNKRISFQMNGIIVSSHKLVDCQCENVYWVHMNVTDTVHAFRSTRKYNWLLIDNQIRVQHRELYALLEYRGRMHGVRQDMELYSIRDEEQMYLDMMTEIMQLGHVRPDRTHVGVRSLFGRTLRFNLLDATIPLLTTKRVFFKGVAKELLWFIKGSTNSKYLQADGVHIWDGNGSRAFLDKRGLSTYEEGELGPVYGYQWRNWGKEYPDGVGGLDQLQTIINTIKTNPYDRRMVMSAWNVSQLDQMALPPCHIMAQFYVHEENDTRYLSCTMYQRSADVFLGVPFNIASYALLTHMIAKVTGTIAYELVMNFGDTHIYSNHTEQALRQIKLYSETKPFGKISINNVNHIDDFTYEDITLRDYASFPSIHAPMAV